MVSHRRLDNPPDVQANRRGQVTPGQRRSAWHAMGALEAIILLVVGGLTISLMAVPAMMTWRQLVETPLAMLIVAAVGLVVGLPVAAFATQLVLRAVQLVQDLREGRVEPVDGNIIWARGRYRADVPGRRPWSADNSVYETAPGAYRLYVLPRSRYVLSAEALSLFHAEAPSLALVLSRVHGAGPNDLDANHGGQLGGRQRLRLLASAFGMSLLLLLILAIGGLTIFSAATSSAPGEGIFAMGLGGLIVGIGGLVIANRVLRLLLDALRGEVASTSGITTKRMTGGRSRSYHYQIDKESFTVSLNAYNALINGLHYRIYYAPRSRQVVAVEPMGKR